MNSEEDIFLSPKAFWNATLQHSRDTLLEREFSQQDRPEPCSTLVVVSVTKRAERYITKEFVGLDVDWSLIGENWSHEQATFERVNACLSRSLSAFGRAI